MKMYLNEQQTAKLIELGFEKPKNALPIREENKALVYQLRYTIGELIDMLPEFSCIYDLTNMHTMERRWYVGHVSTLNVSAVELIDALYNLIIKLKEKGVI